MENKSVTNQEKAYRQSVGQTILLQLGGTNGLSMMIGAHSFILTGKDDLPGVGFRFKARAKGGINYLVFKLRNDEYDVEMWSIRGVNSTKKKEFHGIQPSMFNDLFWNELGLALRAPRIKGL